MTSPKPTTPTAALRLRACLAGEKGGEAMTTTKNFTVRETAKIDGGAYRIVKFPDGSGRVEEWRGGKWVPGGATLDEFLFAPPVSPRFAAELGIPLTDVTIERDEREKPNTAIAPPKERDNEKFLRKAIDLGVKLAEADALFKLTMKARKVRAAEIEKGRPDLIVNTTLH